MDRRQTEREEGKKNEGNKRASYRIYGKISVHAIGRL